MHYLSIHHFLQTRSFSKFITCLLLVISADWLFFDREIGWTLGIFTMLLCVAVKIHTNPLGSAKYLNLLLLLIMGQALALIEKPNALSISLIIGGFVGLSFMQKQGIAHNFQTFLRFILRYVLAFLRSIFADFFLTLAAQKKQQTGSGTILRLITNWLVPVVLSIVFIYLFAQANPIISSWKTKLNFIDIKPLFSIPRILFWAALFVPCWAIIRPRQLLRRIHLKSKSKKTFKENSLLTAPAIFRSLVLFNLIFLVQTGLDISYLWGDAPLPQGMNYAEYAHRGAYPLIVTALLAALFVVVALKPGSHSEQSYPIRVLVTIWVVQNIVLVLSSIWRTLIYIDAYQLTLLRVSAIIWMVLVAIGLVLIIARIGRKQTSQWLITRNVTVLIATLYVCSFVNFNGLVAAYNIKHFYNHIEEGNTLDVYYLRYQIGEDATPALVWLKQTLESRTHLPANAQNALNVINQLRYPTHNYNWRHTWKINKARSWRHWTYRYHRNTHYLEQEGY